MWYAKMYFSGEREFFENDAFGMQGLPSKQLELPFLESLLTFLELDEKEITPMLERISVNWERFVESSDLGAHTAAMVELGMLAEKHIYFRLLYTRCFGCISVNGFDQAEIQAIALDLKEFAKQFSETRKQVEKFLECVLDVDSAGREPQKQAAKNYHHDQPRDPELFRFEPIPLSFEPVEPGRCAPVLYSSAVRDMIDYSLRSCVERGVTVRRCKNCGRWFPQTGRVSAEYCERPVKYGEQRCREIGAFRQWTKKQTDDPIFKAYRKEYKKRFAWIKAGAHHRRAVLRMERAGQRRKEKMRPGDHLAGGVPAVAPRLQNMKLRGRQAVGRVAFVYSGANFVFYAGVFSRSESFCKRKSASKEFAAGPMPAAQKPPAFSALYAR